MVPHSSRICRSRQDGESEIQIKAFPPRVQKHQGDFKAQKWMKNVVLRGARVGRFLCGGRNTWIVFSFSIYFTKLC